MCVSSASVCIKLVIRTMRGACVAPAGAASSVNDTASASASIGGN